jgi:hypothetical protein
MLKVVMEPTELFGKNINLRTESIKPAFARHETFYPRYGWLKKGFDAALVDPSVFNRDDAPVTLGVGKNMVRAIRYWSLAFKILENNPDKRGEVQPTDFGEYLLSEPDGFDPFIEDVATLWLLHWKLLEPPCQATAWYYMFNVLHRTRFAFSELTSGLSEFVEKVFPNYRLAQSSVKKDIGCIIRMYSEPRELSVAKEETIDSPFTVLGLLKRGTEKDQYQFSIGQKLNLPDSIIVVCCLEYVALKSQETRTISLNNLLYSAGSPGQAFRLDEQSLYSAIEKMAARTKSVSVSETAGLIQMSFHDNPELLAQDIMADYCRGRLL